MESDAAFGLMSALLWNSLLIASPVLAAGLFASVLIGVARRWPRTLGR